jgi:photosystem II stability/assembly factor-like uncharacterized protein
MNNRNVLHATIGFAMVISLLAGCTAQETAPAVPSMAETPVAASTSEAEISAVTFTPVPPMAVPVLGFKDSNLCPDSDTGVLVPERLPDVQWPAVDSPSHENIWAIEFLSANDAWAVGEGGSILHYDGETWTAADSPIGTDLHGLSMLSASEGWAVGPVNTILHYTNQRWSAEDTFQFRGNMVWDVDFMAPDRGWVVGLGDLQHYDGNNWKESGVFAWLRGIDMVSVDEGWAVGDSGKILHYQGSTWQQTDSPVETALWDVDMRSTEEGWIVGDNGTILHFDGVVWSITAVPTQAGLYAVTIDDEGEAWAVGSGGTLLRFDGQKWVKMKISDAGGLLDVSVSNDGVVWVVGENGLILRSEWLDSNVPPPTSPLLKTIDNSDGDGSFSVSWERVPGNVNYVLEEADESMCPVTIYFGSETSKDVSRKDMGTYYYRVSALGVGGQSEWSEIKSVEVTVPPPPCSVECTSSSGGLSVKITWESGEYSSPGVFSYEGTGYYPRWDKELWGTHFTEERTYEDSGNVYEVHAFTWPMSDVAGGRGYYVEVTGGVFGETPETCDVLETE